MADDVPVVLKFHAWPQADQTAWKALFAPGDIFDTAGSCRGWSEASRRKRHQSYSQWLSFLKRTSPKALDEAPATRITQNRVRRYIAECECRLRPRSTAGLVADLNVIAMAIAPHVDWPWLSLASNRLLAKANSIGLAEPYPITAAEIFKWSLSRIKEVTSDDDLSLLRQAIHFRQALMIGFLIARPVRRRTLLGMQIDRQIQASARGFELRFGAEDMKDKKAREFSLPTNLVGPMRRYLDHHRPVLLRGKSSDALWISQYGDPITPDGLSRELPKVTERHLGVALRPHAFRHVAATSIAEFDPEHVNVIRDILGHATLNTAEKHYNRATGISSCNALQSLVGTIRKSQGCP